MFHGRSKLILNINLIIILIIIPFNFSYELEIEVGKNVTLYCNTTKANYNVLWKLNNHNVTANKRYTITNNQNNDDDDNKNSLNTLTIIDINISDEGNFSCSINGNDKVLFNYMLQPIIKPHIIEKPNNIKLNKTKSVELFCLIEAYPMKLYENALKWQKDGTDLTTIDNGSIENQLINSTHVNSTLKINSVIKNDNGTYRCVSNEVDSIDNSNDISILVLDVPQISIDYVKAVGANKIFLNWTVNDGNDPIKKIFIQFMKEGDKTFTYYIHGIDGSNRSYVLDNFQPNTNYQLRISAKNSIGDSPIHLFQQSIKTLEADPIFKPIIETTGSSATTITIGWQSPPNNLLEYIQYYELVVIEPGNKSQIIEEATYQQNNRNLPYMFDNLKTATLYEFKVRACSDLSKICGPWSEVVNGTTMDGFSSEPENLNVVCSHFNISRRSTVFISWDYPKHPNGVVVSYLIQMEGFTTFRSEGGYKNDTWSPKIKRVDEPSRKLAFENVNANTNYTVSVAGITRNKKQGQNAIRSCQMPKTTPDTIGGIAWTKIKTNENKYVFKLFLPRISERNGEICCYRIYIVRNNANKNLPLPEDLPISTYNDVHNHSDVGVYLAEMFPGNMYKSEIILGDGKRLFDNNKESQLKADDDCRKCLNGKFFTKNFKIASNSKERKNDDFSIVPEITQREQLSKAGNLTQIASKILDNKKRRRRRKRREEEIINNTVVNRNEIHSNEMYEVIDGIIDGDSNYTGFLEIIVQNDLASVEDVLSSFSNYFEVISSKVSAEDLSSDGMSFVLNIVIQILCALILLVLLLLSALCFMHRYNSKSSAQGDEVISLRDSLSRAFCGGRSNNHRHLISAALAKPTDVGPIAKLDLPQSYVNRHKDTDYGFLREYEMLPNRFSDRTTKNSDMKENATKNRYPDIKAYDQTRVKLSMINSQIGSDYINANFVIGYKERKKFICAQGPMESTLNDFWRMIWEQHLEIIVMLTNLEEYNKAKCAKYWPEKISDSKQFGDINIIFTSEQRFSDYLIRKLDIVKKYGAEDEEEHRQITQYHYLVWKDFMAPEHPHGIIKFIRQINSDYSVQRGPILVHCSAGVGRTGTLVALDSLIQQLEEEDQVSIFNTVCDLRHQRNFLVQSLKQYIFLYRALLDVSQFGNTEISVKSLSTQIENLKQKPNDSKEQCKLEKEFMKIKSIVDETNKSCSVGNAPENASKNRSDLVIPYDRNRVILTPIPIKEHSTYINASFIEGYDNFESFIITQDPLENTIGDFWRMVSEQGITTLVMISEIGDGARKCPRYWADDEIQYDHILVKYMHSESCPYYTRREFNVTNLKIDDTIKVTQFQYNGWPTVEGEVPEVCRGIIELVDQAQKHHNNNDTEQSVKNPITVHCSLGTDRSSIFVAMCILVQQLRTEKKVDICITTRKLRSQRAMLLDTYAQYEFLHRAILNYADLHHLAAENAEEC